MLNLRQVGSQRLNDIKNSLETYQALTVEQVMAMHFRDLKYGGNKARERLQKLSQTYKSVQKERLDTSGKLYYFYEKRPQHNSAAHVINRNWGFLYLTQGKKDYEKVVDLDAEYNLDMLVADGFLGLHNTFTGVTDYWFIESVKASSKNKFEKVLKYTEYYKSGKYKLEHWASKTKRFPGVLIVTDSATKAKRILGLIEKQNAERIRFKVITVEDIKTEIMSNNI
jgi:hypothetical protein